MTKDRNLDDIDKDEGDTNEPQFHHEEDTAIERRGSVVAPHYDYVIHIKGEDENTQEKAKLDSYILQNAGNNVWTLYYVGIKDSKRVVLPKEMPAAVVALLPATAEELRTDTVCRDKIQKVLSYLKDETALLSSFEEFLSDEKKMHDATARLVRDMGFAYAHLSKRQRPDLDLYMDRYKDLVRNHFPESVNLDEAKTTQEKVNIYVTAMKEVITSRAYQDVYKMLQEIVKAYSDFSNDWLNIITNKSAMKNLEEQQTITGYTGIEAPQKIANDAIKSVQHATNSVLQLATIVKNAKKLYPDSEFVKELEEQQAALETIAKRANQDKNLKLRMGFLGVISDASSKAESECADTKIKSLSRKLFRAYDLGVTTQTREVLAETADADHAASFFFEDFIKAYIKAYVNSGTDAAYLEIMQKYIITVDTYLAEKKLNQIVGAAKRTPEHIDDLVFNLLSKPLAIESRIKQGVYECQKSADKTLSAAQVMKTHAEKLSSDLVRYLFDQARAALGEEVKNEEVGEIKQDDQDVAAKRNIYIRAQKSIVHMGKHALSAWNAIAEKEFLELQITGEMATDIKRARDREQAEAFGKLTKLDKTEQKRIQGLVDLVINKYEISLEAMKKSKKEVSAQDFAGFEAFKAKLTSLDTQSLNKAQVRKILQTIMIDINAYAYQIGRRKELMVSAALPTLSETQNFIRSVDIDLVNLGQQPLMVERPEEQEKDPVKNSVSIFKRLPKILGEHHKEYITNLYSNVKLELKKVETFLNEWLTKVDTLTQEKERIVKMTDKKAQGAAQKELEKKVKELEKALKTLTTEEAGPIYKIRMELVNTLKMIQRMDSKEAIQYWNEAYTEDPELATMMKAYERVLLITEGNVLEKGAKKIHESYIKKNFAEIMEFETKERRDLITQSRGFGFSISSRPSVSSSTDRVARVSIFSRPGVQTAEGRKVAKEEKERKENEKDPVKTTPRSPRSSNSDKE